MKTWMFLLALISAAVYAEASEKEKKEAVVVIGGINTDDYQESAKVYVLTEDLKVVSDAVKDVPVAHTYWKADLLGNKVVIIGQGLCYQLSLDTLTWTPAPKTLTKRNHHATAVHDGILYVFGGQDSLGYQLKTVEKYDGTKWIKSKDMPDVQARHCAVEYKGSIYLIGGSNKDSYSASTTMRRFDPSSGVYKDLEPMEKKRGEHQCSLVKIGGVDSILVAGGIYYIDSLPSTELYNLKTGKWSTLADLNTPRGFGGLVYLGGRPVLFGGQSNGAFIKNLEVYSEDKKKWETIANDKLQVSYFGYIKVPATAIKI